MMNFYISSLLNSHKCLANYRVRLINWIVFSGDK